MASNCSTQSSGLLAMYTARIHPVEANSLMIGIGWGIMLISAVGREIRWPLFIEGGSTLLGFIGIDKEIKDIKCE